MGGRGSAGACRNQGRRRLSRYVPSRIFHRLFGSNRRVRRGQSEGAAYTRSTFLNLPPLVTTYYLEFLGAAGHQQAAAGATFSVR